MLHSFPPVFLSCVLSKWVNAETLAIFLSSCSNKALNTIIHQEVISRDSFIIPLINALQTKKGFLTRAEAWSRIVHLFRWLQLNSIKTDWVLDSNTLMQTNLTLLTFVRLVKIEWCSLTEIQPSLNNFANCINSCKILQSIDLTKCSVICDSLRGMLDPNILQNISKLVLQDCNQKLLTCKLIRYFAKHCHQLCKFVLTYHIRTSVFVGEDDGPSLLQLIRNNPRLHTINLFTSGLYGDKIFNRLLEAPRSGLLQDVMITFGFYRELNTTLIVSMLVECKCLRRFMVYSENFFPDERDLEQFTYFDNWEGSGTKQLRIYSRRHNRWSNAATVRLFTNSGNYNCITLNGIYLTTEMTRLIADKNNSLSSFRISYPWHYSSPRISADSLDCMLHQCPGLQSKYGGTFEVNNKLFRGI